MQAQPVSLNASDCNSLIPENWKSGKIESAPLPQQNTVGALATFGISQTGQLDKANDRTHDTITIYENCETLLKKAAKEIEPKPWYQFW